MYTRYSNCLRRDDGVWIPLDERNADYADFVLWEAEGNEAELAPPPSHSELVEQAKAATRLQRQPIITVLDGLQSTALTKGETAKALAIETAKQGLRDITNTDLSACVTYEDMRLAIKHAYAVLAAALPVDIRKAFSDAIN